MTVKDDAAFLVGPFRGRLIGRLHTACIAMILRDAATTTLRVMTL